jgi:hypothetical protein
MKTRFVFSAFCMLVAMTMATGAFAQAVFTVSSGNQPRGRLNGHTEVAGGVTLAKLSGTSVGVGGGSVIIDYGVPITNAVNATGAATADTTDIEVNICGAPITATSAVVTKNTITVTVAAAGCGDDGGDAGDAIDVSGVRLSLAGSGQTGIVATVSSTGGVRLPSGSNQVSVINSIVDELVDDGVTAETLTLIRHTGSPEDGEYFKLLIEENAVDSFAGAALDLDFSGVGAGMTITLDAWVATKEDLDDLKPVEFVLVADDQDTTGEGMDESADNVLKNQQLAFDGDTLTAEITALNNSARVLMDLGGVFRNEDGDLVDDDTTAGINEADIMGGGLDPAKIDVIVIRGKIALTTTGDNAVELPLTLDIMANATVSPIGAAIPPKTGDPERGIPRFASDPSHTVTVIDSTSDQTTLQVAYVLSEGLYNTGIAVANMTSGKSAQTGAVHFDLYMNGQRIGPATADYSYSTSMLGPQSTMSMLLTEVLTGAGHTGRFGGYMIITTDFNEADAGVFISDFAGFTAAATVREIP